MNPTFEEELREQLEKLRPESKRRVLDFVRSLTAEGQSRASGAALCRFGGTIPKEDLDLMARVIEEGCERVNPDEW